ncbi:MAG: LuxR C-terminal-related transcriptional regulator, partial [Defluviicoccus sp.]
PLAADGRPAAAPPRRTLAALRIGRERMPAPLHLLMSRLPDRSTSGALAPVRQALFLSDPHEQPIPQEDWLCALYALSRVEARVTALLAQGEKPHAIASRLGLSVYTVRGYMKEIFHKVGADRQASLIRCLLSGLAQLDGEITVDPVVIGDERAALPHLASTPVTRESHGKPAAPGANGFKFLHK